jgi:hypothetical protein
VFISKSSTFALSENCPPATYDPSRKILVKLWESWAETSNENDVQGELRGRDAEKVEFCSY